MTEFVDRLRAAIDETEKIALDAAGRAAVRTWKRDMISCVEDADGRLVVYGEGTPTRAQADHIARHDPESVLRRAVADRKLLDLHEIRDEPPYPLHPAEYACVVCDYDREDGLVYGPEVACPTVLALAEGYGIEPTPPPNG